MARNMARNKIYEDFHKQTKLPKSVIKENNFTYFHLIKNINKFAPESLKNKTVLDFGCGVGTISFYLANKGGKVLGIDISNLGIQAARAGAKKLRLKNNVEFVQKPTKNLRLKRNNFDVVICSEVIEHVPDDLNLIREFYKVLKSEGILILSTPSKNAPLYQWGLATNFDKKVGHLRRYTANELKKMLNLVGFKVLDVSFEEGLLRNLFFLKWPFNRVIKFIRGPLVIIFTFIDNICVKMIGESQIFIVGKK